MWLFCASPPIESTSTQLAYHSVADCGMWICLNCGPKYDMMTAIAVKITTSAVEKKNRKKFWFELDSNPWLYCDGGNHVRLWNYRILHCAFNEFLLSNSNFFLASIFDAFLTISRFATIKVLTFRQQFETNVRCAWRNSECTILTVVQKWLKCSVQIPFSIHSMGIQMVSRLNAQ